MGLCLRWWIEVGLMGGDEEDGLDTLFGGRLGGCKGLRGDVSCIFCDLEELVQIYPGGLDGVTQ